MNRPLAWGAKVSAEFRQRLLAIAARIVIDPSWLMACMAFESARTFSPSVRNPGSSAVGLIQFMDATARALGTTPEALAAMTAVEQLDYVERYFRPFIGRLASLSDCYMTILWPKAVGASDDTIIFHPDTRAYYANRGLDLNHDGSISVAEAVAKVQELLDEGLRPGNVSQGPSQTVPMPDANGSNESQLQESSSMSDDNSGSLFGMIGDVAASFIPGGALVKALAGKLIGAFAPLVKDKITATLGRHDVDPAIGGQVADNLVQAAMELTKLPDPVDATAAAVKDAQVMEQLQQTALDHVKSLAPIIDKINEYDKDARQQDEASMNAAAARSKGEPRDLAPMLARAGLIGSGVVVAGLGALIGIEAYHDDPLDPQIIGLLITVVTWVMAKVSTLYDYRFGTSRSSAAKDTVISELATRKPPPVGR